MGLSAAKRGQLILLIVAVTTGAAGYSVGRFQSVATVKAAFGSGDGFAAPVQEASLISNRARELYGQKKYAAALHEASAVLVRDPSDAGAYAVMQLSMGQLGIADANSGVQRPEYLSLYTQGKYDEAHESAKAVFRSDPTNSLAEKVMMLTVSAASAPTGEREENKRRAVKHWNAGIIYFQKGDYAKSRDEWLLCKQFDPSNSDCQTGLVRIDSTYGSGS